MLHLLRTIHIVAGALWVGGVFFFALFVLPSARAVGPASGAMMGQLTQVRQFPKWMLIMGTLTLLAGFWLYWLASAGGNSEWMKSTPAMVYGVGAICATLVWVVGITVNVPLAKRLGALSGHIAASGEPATPEQLAQIGAMQARLGLLANAAAALLIVATITMAVARYTT